MRFVAVKSEAKQAQAMAFKTRDLLARHGCPEVFNTDQGSQFTSRAFTGALERREIKISMDGRGRCMDNVFIERLWRSLKYEAVYLHDMADGRDGRHVIGQWVRFYNAQRPHSALAGHTQVEAHGAPAKTPVDMLDKPHGLPTSPPARRQPAIAPWPEAFAA